MRAINLIAQALSESERSALPCPPVDGVCAVTGERGPCIPRSELFGKSFTNLDLLAAPQSSMVGIDAYYALSYKWERMSAWICDGVTFRRLQRTEIRQLVLEGVDAPAWAAYATTSYKKHGALWAKVNSGRRGVWRFETRDADCSNERAMLAIWDRLNLELRGGIGRSILESLVCPAFMLPKIGLKRWMDFERWARPLYQGSLYQFMCYLLPSQEELKNECSNPTC